MTEYKTPADEGIQAAKQDVREREEIRHILARFQSFVMDSMAEGMHREFYDVNKYLKSPEGLYTDQAAFLKACLETFTDIEGIYKRVGDD